MCWGLETVKWSQSDTESQNLNHLSCGIYKSYRKRWDFGSQRWPRECVQEWECCERVKAAAVRQTSAGETPSTWQKQAHTPAQGLGFMPAVGSAGGHGDRRALPLQARLCTQKGRALLLSPGLQGCDRQFFNASLQFTNMDRVMEEVNKFTYQHGISV